MVLALEESERRMRTLLANLPGMAYRCRNDRNWTMTFCSEGSVALLGAPPEDLLSGRAAYNDFILSEDRDHVWAEVQSALADGQPFQLRYRIRHRHGEVRHVWEKGRGVFNRDGVLLALEGIIMDVSEMVRSEARLADSEMRFRRIFEDSKDAIIVAGLDGKINEVNRQFAIATGYTREELVTMTVVEMHPVEALAEAMTHLREVIEKGETSFVLPLNRKGGGSVLMEVNARRVAYEGGLIIGICRDVEERRRAEEERRSLLERESAARLVAEAAVKLRDEFISVAAHELKTPVATLQIALERLRHLGPENLSQEASARSLEIAERQAQRLVRMVNGLLDLTRISTGRFELQRVTFDLAELVRDVIQRDESLLAQAGCSVDAAGLVPVRGSWDRDRLDQVVENLLLNALKFGRGLPIHVSTFLSGNQALFIVNDHGIGIAPGHEQRIFEAYERGGSERHYGGLGMGLYISRAIVQSHGGTITAGNMPEGGAVFTVELPLA